MRDLQLPGRSPVHSTHGMAATSHPLSTLAAVDILKAGGNALDAAVAACAVQCVVEPGSTGIGGDCFCLYAREGTTDLIAYNGSGRAPAAAGPEWYRTRGITRIERQSPHAVTVPGAVDAWARLVADHGRMSLSELLRPAIALAREGYPISSRIAFDFALQTELLRANEAAARTFLKDGAPPAVGSRQRQPAMAATLEIIARDGRDGFYRGAVAQDIVGYLQSLGGLHTLEDFAAACGEYVTPISTEYRGFRVFECPPNGQGVIALLLLNIMRGIAPAADLLGAERIAQEVEAGRRAYRDRALYVADPAFSDVPVAWLLSEEHARELREEIMAGGRAAREAYTAPMHASTVYISVVDKDRNACSFINSLFNQFGSGLMAPESGVVLHNRGEGFVLEEGHPNCIAPRKRPLHTIIPAMLAKDDRVVMPFGVMGGQYQAFGHMQFLTRLLDYRFDVQEAQDLPRYFCDPATGVVQLESGILQATAEELVQRGYRIERAQRPHGGSQAIWIDWKEGVLTGGSDPRKDGCAIGY